MRRRRIAVICITCVTCVLLRHLCVCVCEHSRIIHRARSSHMVQAYAAANVQACGTISGAHGAVDNRERRDLLDLEQQEEEEDVQQDEQQRDERQEEQRGEQQVEQQSRAGCERRAAGGAAG